MTWLGNQRIWNTNHLTPSLPFLPFHFFLFLPYLDFNFLTIAKNNNNKLVMKLSYSDKRCLTNQKKITAEFTDKARQKCTKL